MTGTFTAGAVLTAANLNTAINSLTLNAQSGAGYTLVLTDAGKLVTVSNASAQNLTIPLNSSVAYPTGTIIEALNIGAGTWTVTATGGVTLNGTTAVPTGRQVRLVKTGTDTWYSQPYGGSGLTYITSSTFTTAANVSVNNCFTSAYENYLVVVNISATSTNQNVSFRFRASAADDTNAVYDYAVSRSSSAGAGSTGSIQSGQNATSAVIQELTSAGTMENSLVMTFLRPQTANKKNVVLDGIGGPFGVADMGRTLGGVVHNNTTAFDGFSLYVGGTFTGTVRVYGYSNS